MASVGGGEDDEIVLLKSKLNELLLTPNKELDDMTKFRSP